MEKVAARSASSLLPGLLSLVHKPAAAKDIEHTQQAQLDQRHVYHAHCINFPPAHNNFHTHYISMATPAIHHHNVSLLQNPIYENEIEQRHILCYCHRHCNE